MSEQPKPPPTAAEMLHFSKGFTFEDWQVLCADQGFLNTFPDELEPCRIQAEKILARHRKLHPAPVTIPSPS